MRKLCDTLRMFAVLLFMLAPSAGFAEDPSAAKDQMDRLELDASYIKGNQELPKVLYIVPWKESDIGALTGKPVNSLLDEVLAPLDREVFKRHVRYFDQLYADQVSAHEEE